MTEPQLITILLALVATFFALLVAITGWMSNKLYNKLSEMATTMHNIESDTHGRITDVDKRVTRVETILERNYNNG